MNHHHYPASIIAYLNQDRILHATVLESMKKKQAEIISFSRQGVLILDVPSQTMMISAASSVHFNLLIEDLKQAYDFLVFQEEYAPLVAQRFQLKLAATYWQAIYPVADKLVLDPLIKFRKLAVSDYEWVKEDYSTQDEDYLEDRVAKGCLWGGFVNQKCVGFVGIHDDGSMGLLQVLKRWQGQGYGHELLAFMTNHYLDENWIPYSQITVDNERSIQLHRSLGYRLSDKKVIWLRHQDHR